MATTYDIKVDKGTDLIIPIELFDSEDEPLDLQGYTARMHIKKKFDSEEKLDTLTTENERIRIEGNKIDLIFTNGGTSEYEAGMYFYDLEYIDPNGLVKRLLQGRFIVVPEITV